MTTFVLNKTKQGIYKGFTFMGHAEAGRKGRYDLLCCAISVLAINTMNSIEELTEDKFSCKKNEKDGFIDFKFDKEPSKESILLVDSLVLGLTALSKEYGSKYLTVRNEEV